MDPTESLPDLKVKYARLRKDYGRLKDFNESPDVLELVDKGLEAVARQIVIKENNPEHRAYLKEIKDQEHDIAQGRYSNFRRIFVEHLHFRELLEDDEQNERRIRMIRQRLTREQWEIFKAFIVEPTPNTSRRVEPQRSHKTLKGQPMERAETRDYNKAAGKKAAKRNGVPDRPPRTDGMF